MVRAPCCDKVGLKKGPWTPEEDQKLIDYIQKHGHGSWKTLSKNAGLRRCGKSCRLRWTNYVRPDIKKGRFSFEEEETIIKLHSILGNKWSQVAAHLPGRTDNDIKNYWNTHIRKRLLRMGIDPVTHTPRLDLLGLSSILNSPLYNTSPQAISTMATTLGLNPLVNPDDLVSLAASLLLSLSQNRSFQMQNIQSCHQLFSNLSHDQYASPCISFPCEVQVTEPALVQYQSSIVDFDAQNLGLACDDQWQGNMIQDSDSPSVYDDQTYLVSSASTNSPYMSFESVLSTPCSSPVPFDPNSTTRYFHNGTAEDAREGYCSSVVSFEIPLVFDLSEFMF